MDDHYAIKGVVFDLYGTLIYTPGSDFSVRYADLASNLSHIENFPTLNTSLTTVYETLWTNEITETEAWINEYEATEEILNGCMLYPGSLELLTGLKRLGFQIGVISNVSTPYKRPFYDLGLNKYVDHVIFSCEVGYKKPDPKIFEIFNRTFNVNPKNILLCGDSIVNDMALAKACGIKAVLVDHESHKQYTCMDTDYNRPQQHPWVTSNDYVKVTSLYEISDLVKRVQSRNQFS